MTNYILVIAVTVLIVILIIAYMAMVGFARPRTDKYVIKGMVVNVISDFDNRDDAVRIMIECNSRVVRLLDYLRKKYKIGIPDEECKGKCAKWLKDHHQTREIVRHLLRDFNYEEIHEHRPNAGSQSVAYSLDKGKTIMLCLRGIEDPHKIVEIDVLMFVILHEASHIANYDEWGHKTKFWSIFKYLLEESTRIGIYVPIDYSHKPQNYCGFYLNHNPLYDSRIETLDTKK